MKVVYQGDRPTRLITVTLEGLPESEAVRRILEGLGVGYLFKTDPSRRRVETLIIHGSTGPVPTPASTRASSPQGKQPIDPPEEPFLGDDSPDELSETTEVPFTAPESAPTPEPSPFAPGGPPAGVGQTRGLFPSLPGFPSPGANALRFPVPASNPAPPNPAVLPPVFPQDPSHPASPPQD